MASLADALGITFDADSHEPLAGAVEPRTAEQFAKAILESPEYRLSLMQRIIDGELSSAVELRLMDHGWGKPAERIEFKDTTDDFSDATPEYLEQRIQLLAKAAATLRAKEKPVADAVH